MAAVLCYPYGVTITCVCDNTGSVYNCYPTNYKNKHNSHLTTNSAVQVSRVVYVDSRIPGCRIVDTMCMLQDDRLMKPEKSRGDQTVEIILATTALVTVIALFLRSAPAPPRPAPSLSMSMLI